MSNWQSGPVYEHHEELDSTNVRALQLARDAGANLPMVVVAERQTAGKGRGSNRWWSARGALTFSLLVDASEERIPGIHWPLVSLLTAMVVADTLGPHFPDGRWRVKWPNDVYLNDKKICGILVEIPPVRPARLVVGIGINVNNSLREAPEDVQARATSLLDESEREHYRRGLLTQIVDSLLAQLEPFSRSDLRFLQRWPQRCLLTGKEVVVDCTSHLVQGKCEGIDNAGALIVRTTGGVEHLFAGVVKHWE